MEHGGLSGHVDDLFVRPACRRRGVARALLGELFAECRTRGCLSVQVEAAQDNAAALGLYAHFGLVPHGDGRLLLAGPVAASARREAHDAVKAPDSQHFRFEPLREQDLPMLREWLLRPHVAERWGPAESVAALRENYLVAPSRNPSTARAYIASAGGRPVGFIQSYVVMGSGEGWWEGEMDPGARGTDQFLAEADQLGRGIGTAMLRAFLRMEFADPAVTVVQTDPHPRNVHAIRCYERAGFRAVGQVDTPDGPALLMRCTRQSMDEG